MVTRYEEEATLLIPNHGIPTGVRDDREPRKKQLAVNLILASTLFERIAFYTLAANIALNLETEKKLKWSSKNGLIASFIFSGTSYISAIIFGVISDWKVGRARTILVGFVLYLIGYVLAIVVITKKIGEHGSNVVTHNSTSSATTIFDEPYASWILPTLITIAMGAGAVQSNMAVFGAEQIQESKETSRYFDEYVVAVNIGAFFALLATPFTLDNPKVYHTVYIVTASVLLIATSLFIIGWRYYIHINLNETVITKCIPVVINAFQTWRQYQQRIRPGDEEYRNSAPSNLISASHSLTEEERIRISERPLAFLDFAKAANGGKFHDRIVNDVKSLRKAFVVFTLLIPYWLIYQQINSIFRVQSRPTRDPGAQHMFIFVSLADPVTIIIGLLIFNMFIYKCLDARNQSSTIVTKFVTGMCFAFVTMCIAGTVEKFRLDEHDTRHDVNWHNSTVYVQISQGIFIGCSELFAMLASFEYAYFAAPRSAQTLFMSLRFCSVGIASFLGAAYLAVFSKVSSSPSSCESNGEKHCSYFYLYFFILAGLQFIFIIIFIVCQKKFRLIELNPQQMETDQFRRRSLTSSTARP